MPEAAYSTERHSSTTLVGVYVLFILYLTSKVPLRYSISSARESWSTRAEKVKQNRLRQANRDQGWDGFMEKRGTRVTELLERLYMFVFLTIGGLFQTTLKHNISSKYSHSITLPPGKLWLL